MFEPFPVHQIAQCGGRAGDRLLISFNISPAGFFSDGAQAQADLLLILVHLDDLEVVLLASFELDRLTHRIGGFRDVA